MAKFDPIFTIASQKQTADDLARMVREFKAQGNTVTQCAPAKAQGAQMSKRAAKSVASARREFKKDQEDVR
jgi:hypothetical protein